MRPTQDCTVDPDLLGGWHEARRICANLLADSGDMSSKQFVTLLEKQLDLLTNLDETFEVEMALLKAVSEDY